MALRAVEKFAGSETLDYTASLSWAKSTVMTSTWSRVRSAETCQRQNCSDALFVVIFNAAYLETRTKTHLKKSSPGTAEQATRLRRGCERGDRAPIGDEPSPDLNEYGGRVSGQNTLKTRTDT